MRACIFGGAAILLATAWLPAVAQQHPYERVLTPDQIEAADPEQLEIVDGLVKDLDLGVELSRELARLGYCENVVSRLEVLETKYAAPDALKGASLRRSQKEAVRAYALKKLIEARKIECPPPGGQTRVAAADVCVPPGSGFYYIPGADRCRRIGGGFSFSQVGTGSIFGAGTAVDTEEHFVAETPNSINRLGFSLGGALHLPGAGILPGSNRFVFGNFAYARGSASASGDATVGIDGVSKVGHTFLFGDGGLGTGVSTSTPGNFIEGTAKVSNDWVVGSFGYGESFQSSGPLGPTVSVGAQVSAEFFRNVYSAESRIYDPTPLTLLSSQEISDEMVERYLFMALMGDVTFQVTDAFSVGVGAVVGPTLHFFDAEMTQFTSFGSVSQSLDASGTDVDVIAGVNAYLLWRAQENLRVGARVEWWRLPVTAVNVPPKPDAQPGGFDQDYISILQGMVQLSVEF